jgi:hypothetical protein
MISFFSLLDSASGTYVQFSLNFYSLLLIQADLSCVIEGLADRICRQSQF